MQRSQAVFNSLYKKLNPEQKRAVDVIEGPVMVIAGPGTGKTQILTLRIANILKSTDTSPDSILALTFTESAAFGMRRRLVDIIGADAYKINIFTFHGFANEIIKKYPEEFERIIGSRNITEIDQIRILKRILDSGKFQLIRPYGDPYYYLRSGLDAIKELKREDISVSKLKDLIEEQREEFKKIPDLYHEKGAHKGKMKGKWSLLKKSIDKNLELLVLYESYQKELFEGKLYDFEDMIMETVRVLDSNPELLLELQETYQYVLADEHQDTNNSQNKLLELIGSFHENPNLFVVGDEKQAIFRFQGASLENFLYFKEKYKSAEIIFLTSNYRSGQEILDASGSLIKKDEDERAAKYRVDLKAFNKWRSSVRLYRFDSEFEEQEFVKEEIKTLTAKGVSLSEIAILYRDNRDAAPFAKKLAEGNISYRIESNVSLLEDENSWKLTSILRAVNDLSNDVNLAEALYMDFLGLKPYDVHLLIRNSSKTRSSIFKTLSKVYGESDLYESPDRLRDIQKKLEYWSIKAKNKHFLDFLSILLTESGLLSYALGKGQETLSKVENYYEEARKASASKPDYRLSDFIDYIDLIETHGLTLKSREGNNNAQAVRLMTAHRSKGLEFDYVFIVGLTEGHWGSRREVKYFKLPIYKNFDFDGDQDERKLLYVALTRAKKECILSYHNVSGDGKNLLPSIFLSEIDQSILVEEKTKEISRSIVEITKPVETIIPLADKAYITSIFEEKGLSVSALNNYLECPSKYFFENLIRIPQSPNKYQHYGTAVHESIDELHKLIERNKPYTKKIFLDIFRRNLQDKSLSREDLDELQKKGEESLGGFYDSNIENWVKERSLSELNIAGVFLDINENQKVLLRGRLDKLTFNDEGHAIAIDYKTAKPKSRNVVAGETKSSDGNYFRQLLFYKILLDQYDKSKYSMYGGRIEFTEPDEKGRYISHYFDITTEMTSALKEEIIRISKEILDLSFLSKGCGKKNCQYCRMLKHLNYDDNSVSKNDLNSK